MADKKTLEYQIEVLADKAVECLSDMSAKFKGMAEKASDASEKIKKNSSTFTDLESAAKQAATSIKLFGASSSELRAMQQKLKDGTLDLIAQGFKPEQSEIKKLVEEYKNLGSQADALDSKNDDLMGMFQKLKSEVGKLAVTVAAVKFDKFLAKTASYALESADSINTVRNNFGIMLNDMEAGSALADRINAFNVNTPFNLEQLSTATQVLKTAKVGLNDMEEYLTRFGDLALGDSQKFASFTNAFAKASAKGKADMEVLNIYLERGIPILDTLAKNLGKTSAEITDMASKGKISFNDLNNAIKTLTNEGGGYFGTMNLAADSWASTLAGAREATNSLAASLGNMLMPILKRIVNAYTEITNAINSSPLFKGLLVGAITAIAVAINVKMIVALVALVARIWTTYAAQMALNSALSLTNPLMLAGIAAVTAATAGFVAYAAAQQKAHSESSELALSLCQQKDAMENLKVEAEKFMMFMNGTSLDKAQKTVKDYETSVLSAKQKLESSTKWLAELKEKLSVTPKTVKVELEGKRFAGLTRNERNSDYTNLEKQVEQAQRIVAGDQALYDTLSARLEVARKNTGEIRQKILDFTTEWSQKLADNNSSAVERIAAQQSKAEKKLEKAALEAFGKNYLDKTTDEYRTYQRELTSLRAYYARERQKQIDKEAEDARKKIEEALKTVTSWIDKGGTSPYQRIQEQIHAVPGETARSIEKLKKAAETAFGKEYETNAQYVKALASLKEYYLNKEHDLRMQQVEEYNSRFQKIISELNLKTVEAINAGNVKEAAANGAKAAALNSASGTAAGQVAAGFANGGVLGGLVAAIISFVNAIVSATAELENGKKALNFISTIVEKIFAEIGDNINNTLAPAVNFFEKLGTAIGKILKPLAEINEDVAEVEPILKVITGLLDGLSTFLEGLHDATNNSILGTLINPIGAIRKHFSSAADSAEDAEKAAKAIEKAQTEIKKLYERQIERVRDLLYAQIESLRMQYELGLITRDEYDRSVLKYQEDADDKVLSLEEEMNEHLKEIEKNTRPSRYTEEDLERTIRDDINKTAEAAKTAEKEALKASEEAKKDINNGLDKIFEETAKQTEKINKESQDELQKGIENALNPNTGVQTYTPDVPNANDIVQKANETAESIGKEVDDSIKKTVDSLTKTTETIPEIKLPEIEIPKIKTPQLTFNPDGTFSVQYADGTPEIPRDMPAIVHKGETIVPRTFAEGIRRGDLALVGGKSGGTGSGNIINVQLNVHGSVVTQQEITDAVYNGIALGIRSGKKAPLPMSA